MGIAKLKEALSWEEQRHLIEGYLRRMSDAGACLKILEAGCGRNWPLKMDGIAHELTGVDRDAEALRLRKEVRKDLHHSIEGDLLDVDIDAGGYDVVYSAFVLEHIEDAERAMANFCRWTKPGGIIVLRIPDPESVRGYITKITPHWFHILFYRYIFGEKNAGKPGYNPYPTYYAPVVSRTGMREYCSRNDLAVEEERGCDGYQKSRMGLLINMVTRIVSMLSFGRLASDHVNLLYVLRKNQVAA